MKTHGIDIQQDGINITKLSDDGSLSSNDDETLITSKTGKSYIDDKVKSGCRVYRTAVQNIPDAVWTKIQFNVEDYDNLNEYDHVTNYRFTATKAGIYMVSSSVSIQHDADSRIICGVSKNGTLYARGFDFTTSIASYGSSHISVPVKLAANDYVEILVYQNSTGAQNTWNTASTVYMIVQRMV